MPNETIEELKALNEKLDSTLKAATAAQKRASELDAFEAKTDSALQKAAEESAKAYAEAQELKQKIDAVEKTAQYMEKMVSRMGTSNDDAQKEMEAKAHNETIRYLRDGSPISEEVVRATCEAICTKGIFGVPEEKLQAEIKTLMAGSNPDGGYFIRPERSAKMIQRIFETSAMRSIADVQTTGSDSLEMIIDDDLAGTGGWVCEIEERTNTSTPKIGKLTIPVHEQYAQPRATQKMLDDAGFDIESWLTRKVTTSMTREENRAFVVGDGAGKPRGFLNLPAWTTPGTYQRGALEHINSGVSGAVTGDTLKALQAALIEEYQANATWVMNRTSWVGVITLKDSNGAYLLDPRSMKVGDTMTLLGRPVRFMTDMPATAADARAVAYGDFNAGYTIVDRTGFRVVRDQYTQKPFTLFYTTKRTGGDVTNYESIKILQLSV